MTQEEKVIAYDEALNKIKPLYEQAKKDGNPIWSTYEYLIPELAESEDERIRKWLVDYFKSVGKSWIHRDISPEQILSWLEKQKEQNNATLQEAFEKSKKDFSLEEKKQASDYAESILPTSVTYGESEDEYKLHKIIEAAFIAGQKEHKPLTIESAYEKFVNPETLKKARTNKYIRAQLLWELMHNGIITEVDYQYLTDNQRKPWTAEEYRIAYQKGFEMSEQLKQKEQKPYEPKNWPADKDNLTQEQKPVKYGDDIVEEAEEYTSKVDCGEYGVEVTEAYIAGVLSERNRGTEWSAKGRRGRIGTTPEHIRKKAENFLSKMEPPYDADDICSAYETGAMENANPSWSEEDDQLIGFIFDLLNDLVWRKDWAMSKEECLERLKSLRPQSQWKPEGQQLDCLRHMINVSTVGKIDKQFVQDLYEQLKKLM